MHVRTVLQGVPVRVEVGPRDVAANACVLSRRDRPGKEGKTFGVPAEPAAFVVGTSTLAQTLCPRLTDRQTQRAAKAHEYCSDLLCDSDGQLSDMSPTARLWQLPWGGGHSAKCATRHTGSRPPSPNDLSSPA